MRRYYHEIRRLCQGIDYRGKFMDGEVSVIVAGGAALIAYLDFDFVSYQRGLT